MTSSTIPWNEVYKLAAGKNNTQLTTVTEPDGSLTADISETLQHMLEYFTPEGKEMTILTSTNKAEHNLKNLWTTPTTKTSL
jgi:hypothetical protein